MAAALVLIRPAETVFGISPGSVALFFAYLLGTRAVFRHASREGQVAPVFEAGAREARPLSIRRAGVGFALAALVVLASAPAFAWSAKGIAALTGLGNTFVGTWLVGFATSLPELVACLAAVRMGAFDLAVGNLFGSKAINMLIFLPLDLAQPGSLFTAIDPNHALSGLFAVILMSLGLAAIVCRAKRRSTMLDPDSLLIVVTYVVALWLLYRSSVGH